MNAHPRQRRKAGCKRRLLSASLLVGMSSLALAAGPTDSLLLRETAGVPMPDDVYHQGTVIENSELASMRGGFNIAGLQVSFGATLKSTINQVKYETVLKLTGAGPQVVSQSMTDSSGTAVAVGGGSGVSLQSLLPSNVTLGGLSSASGVVLSDASGFTAALHNITRNAITSSVVSNASGQSIDQQIDISVTIGNNLSQLRTLQQQQAFMRSLQRF